VHTQTPNHSGIVRVNLDDVLTDRVIDTLIDELARITSGQYTGNVSYTDLFKFSSDLEGTFGHRVNQHQAPSLRTYLPRFQPTQLLAKWKTQWASGPRLWAPLS
jgi:hypothetical protein